ARDDRVVRPRIEAIVRVANQRTRSRVADGDPLIWRKSAAIWRERRRRDFGSTQAGSTGSFESIAFLTFFQFGESAFAQKQSQSGSNDRVLGQFCDSGCVISIHGRGRHAASRSDGRRSDTGTRTWRRALPGRAAGTPRESRAAGQVSDVEREPA